MASTLESRSGAPEAKGSGAGKNGNEIVDSPEHYCSRVSSKKMKHIIKRIADRGYIEVIDIVDAWDLDFQLGNAIKYELRLGKKDDAVVELDKAIKYLEFKKEMILAERAES